MPGGVAVAELLPGMRRSALPETGSASASGLGRDGAAPRVFRIDLARIRALAGQPEQPDEAPTALPDRVIRG